MAFELLDKGCEKICEYERSGDEQGCERMDTWQIKDWQKQFDRYHKNTEVVLRWIAMPTKHDGRGIKRIGKHPQGAIAFAAWVLMVQVAAKMPIRGILADEKAPLTSEDLSDMTGFPQSIFDVGFTVLSSPEIGWLVQTSLDKSRQVSPTVQDNTVQDNTEHTCEPLQSDGFDAFWKEWPKHKRKKGRSKCQRIWKRMNLDTMTEVVVAAVKRFKNSPEWRENNGQYVPGPEPWLNDESWEVPPETLVESDAGRDAPRRKPTVEDLVVAAGTNGENP